MTIGQNPYEAPKADLGGGAPLLEPELLPAAGMGARFLNFIIDGIIVRVVMTVFVLGVVGAAGAAGDADSAAALGAVLALGVMFAYYIVLEGAFGWTVAKLVTGTRVLRYDGGKARWPQVIGRTFARFIPFEPFSILFSSSTQGWHDSLSGTRVVKVRR